MVKNIFNKQKIILFLLAIITASLAIFIRVYWAMVCDQGGCSYSLRQNIFIPSYYASLSLLGFSTFFLFLPIRYFYWWLLFIFSWGFPVSVLLVLERLGPTTGPLPIFARETIIILSVVFGALTLLFVGGMYWLERRKAHRAAVNHKVR